MVEVSATTVLTVWEAADEVPGHRRALALLDPVPQSDAADLPLGSRDAALLGLFRELRGSDVEALATCPTCLTTLEIRLAVTDLVEGYPRTPERSEAHDVDLGGVVVRARCPTTADLIAIGTEPTLEAARAALVDRCVESVRRDCSDDRPLDDGDVARLSSHLERLDPLADVRIDVRCADCGYSWSALLDVPDLVWAQVQGTAQRLLREIDVLAQRYGWSQSEIIGMSERRRRAFLDLA